VNGGIRQPGCWSESSMMFICILYMNLWNWLEELWETLSIILKDSAKFYENESEALELQQMVHCRQNPKGNITSESAEIYFETQWKIIMYVFRILEHTTVLGRHGGNLYMCLSTWPRKGRICTQT
jgi:hypothetical protein